MATIIITDTVIVPNRFEVVRWIEELHCDEQLACCDTWRELQLLKSRFNRCEYIDHESECCGLMRDLPTVAEFPLEDCIVW